jgi:hypothetical protein
VPIKANNFDGRVEGVDELLEHFEVDPDPVQLQQRRTTAVSFAVAFTDGYPQALPADGDGARPGLWPGGLWCHESVLYLNTLREES